MIGGWGTPDEMTIDSPKSNVPFVPFMAVKEYEYIRDLINTEKFETVLEWGAGSSTIWFPNNTTIKSWLAIEHNEKYIEYLKDKVSDKVELSLRTTHHSYLDVISRRFDLILIDGLYRDECLERAFDLLNPRGIILLHDAGRKAYHDFYDKYPHEIVFEGEGWLGDGWDHRGITAFRTNL